MTYRCACDIAPLIVKPRKAPVMLSCSQNWLYELLNAGELQSFKDGKSRKITSESINANIKRKLDEERRRRPKRK